MTIRSIATSLGRTIAPHRGSRPEDTTLRVAADETVTVSFTVNGRPATVDVAPRVTLSDALRDHLGLTGTHIGCEHGVCGMCTVVVDGDAARACLLLACQMEGAEILTVEGLGKQDDLHPLQASFSDHHALQCGFCTPGMLMSSYDLLRHEPGIPAEELPEQMSGVLCRCTGYRHIMDAVADVSDSYPDGIPAPRNCAEAALLPRTSTGGRSAADGDHEVAAATGPGEIHVPQSEPTVTIDVTSGVTAGVDELWVVIDDTERMARCLPGAELVADFGDDKYQGRIQVALGPVKLSFLGDIHVIERDPVTHSLRALAQADDPSGGTVQGVVHLKVDPSGEGSIIRAHAEMHMTGRIAQFGRSLAGDVSKDMFSQFTAALDATARGEEPVAGGAPPSAVQMTVRLITSRARAIVQRIKRKD